MYRNCYLSVHVKADFLPLYQYTFTIDGGVWKSIRKKIKYFEHLTSHDDSWYTDYSGYRYLLCIMTLKVFFCLYLPIEIYEHASLSSQTLKYNIKKIGPWRGEGGMVGNIGLLASHLSHLTRYHHTYFVLSFLSTADNVIWQILFIQVDVYCTKTIRVHPCWNWSTLTTWIYFFYKYLFVNLNHKFV